MATTTGNPDPGNPGGPAGYYSKVNTSSPSQLRCSLHATIKGHTAYPYSGSGTSTWTILEIADEDPNNPNRILDAYRAIALVMPNAQVKQRIADVQLQIKNVQENYSSQDEGHFKTPESDRQAIQMLQLAKKMRAVLRVEHNKGKIDPHGFAQEERRLELMQLKINIANLIKRAMDAQIQGQYGTCRQLYTKGLGALANVSDKDPYLLAREEDMRQGMRQLEEHLQQHRSPAAAS